MTQKPIKIKIASEQWDVFCTAIVNTLGRGISALVSLLVLPVLLKQHGQTGAALWASAIALSSIFAFADLGLANAIMNRQAKLYVTGSSSAGLNLMAHACALNAVVALLLLGFYLYLLFHTDLANRFVSGSFVDETTPVLLSAGLPVIIAAPFTIITKAAAAESRAREDAIWQISAAALALLSLLAITQFHAPLWVSVLAFTIWPALARIIQAVRYLREKKPVKITKSGCVEIINSGVARAALLFLSLQLASTIAFSLDAWIVTTSAGSRDTLIYSGLLKLFALPQLVVSAAASSLWPQMTRMLARNEHRPLAQFIITLSLLSAGVVSAFGGILIVSKHAIFGRWLGLDYIPSTPLIIVTTIATIAIVVGTIWGLALNAMEIIKFQIIAAVLMSSILVFLKVFLCDELGLIGMPLATLIGYIPIGLIPSVILVTKRLRMQP